MTNPEHKPLQVVAIMVTGTGKHGAAETLGGQFDEPVGSAYWKERGYATVDLTPLAEAQTEIAQLAAEREAAVADARRLREALEGAYPLAIGHAAAYKHQHDMDEVHPIHAAILEMSRAALAATGATP